MAAVVSGGGGSGKPKVNFFAVERGLPVELQLEVLKRLDLPSLARFSGASRRYHQLGNDRAVWEALVDRMRLLSEHERERNLETGRLKTIARFYLQLIAGNPQNGITIDLGGHSTTNRFSEVSPYAWGFCDHNAINHHFFAYVKPDDGSTVRVNRRRGGETLFEHTSEELVLGLKLLRNRMAVLTKTTVGVWRLPEGICEHMIQYHHNATRGIPRTAYGSRFAYDGKRVCIGLRQREIVEIDLATGTLTSFGRIGTAQEEIWEITALCISGDDLFTGNEDGNILRWDLTEHICAEMIPQRHFSDVYGLTVIGDKLLVSAGRQEGMDYSMSLGPVDGELVGFGRWDKPFDGIQSDGMSVLFVDLSTEGPRCVSFRPMHSYDI